MKKRLSVVILSLGMLAVLGGVFVSPVGAQFADIPADQVTQVSPTPSAPPLEESAGKGGVAPNGQPAMANEEPDDNLSGIAAAKKKYYDFVAQYRDAEDKFNIARGQYYNLNTLAAQDEALRRGKEVLRVRDEVLISYLVYLQLVLESTKGVEITQKESQIRQLESWQDILTTHREAVNGLTSRSGVNQHMLTLNDQEEQVQSVGYSTLMLIKMGQIQTAIDTGGITREYLATKTESSDIAAAEKAIKQRGLEEVQRLLQSARNTLYKLQQDFNRDIKSLNMNDLTYRRFQENAEHSYLQLRQAREFMSEIGEGLK